MKEGAFELGPRRLGRISPGGRKRPVSVQTSPSGKGRESTMRESQIFQPGAGLGGN